MTRKLNYWIGPKPSSGKGWQNAEHGTILEPSTYGDQFFRLYRRYVKQWNDIELDVSRGLNEHTHSVCGAKVVSASGRFILEHNSNRETGWILELKFSRGFRQFYPGLSTGLNAFRTINDLQKITFHWRGEGESSFWQWLVLELQENGSKGEWNEYKS